MRTTHRTNRPIGRTNGVSRTKRSPGWRGVALGVGEKLTAATANVSATRPDRSAGPGPDPGRPLPEDLQVVVGETDGTQSEHQPQREQPDTDGHDQNTTWVIP